MRGIVEIDRWLAHNLPTSFLRDFYPRAMRRLTEYGLARGNYIRETNHGFRMHVDRLDALSWCVHYFGQWEPGISAAIKAVLPRGGTMVDIGGNIGYTALLGATVVGPAGRVFTFEPCSRTYGKLLSNIALNGLRNVTAINAAVADRDAEATLHCMADNELGQASLLPRKGANRTERVRTVTLSTALAGIDLQGIDLIKIDVEGAEDQVLDGLTAMLPGLKPSCAIILEVSPAKSVVQMIAPLADAGFHARRIHNGYSTTDYRGLNHQPLAHMFTGIGEVQDLVLCRSAEIFETIDRAMHRSLRMPSTSRASRPSRTPSPASPPLPARH